MLRVTGKCRNSSTDGRFLAITAGEHHGIANTALEIRYSQNRLHQNRIGQTEGMLLTLHFEIGRHDDRIMLQRHQDAGQYAEDVYINFSFIVCGSLRDCNLQQFIAERGRQ